MDSPLTSFDELKPGDVVVVEVLLEDRQTPGRYFPWRYFACVSQVFNRRHMNAIRLQLDSAKWVERSHMVGTREKITLVPEDQVPPGPAAVKMKLLAKRVIALGGA